MIARREVCGVAIVGSVLVVVVLMLELEWRGVFLMELWQLASREDDLVSCGESKIVVWRNQMLPIEDGSCLRVDEIC
jgi:hypothetical protein